MKILTLIMVVFMLFIINVVTAQNKTITATVVNATSDIGTVRFALYTKKDFMKKPVQGKIAKIKNRKSVVVFENVPKGEYAVICFHDKNDNNKMDFQPNGMPIEDYGASNNVMRFAPPQYEEAKFIVTDKNITLDIKF